MKRLLAYTTIDPDLGFHYAFIRPTKLISEVHCHDFFEFFITFDDRVVHLINGHKQELLAGSLILIRPDDQHAYEISLKSKCHIMNVAFTQAVFDSMQNYLGSEAFYNFAMHSEMPPILQLKSFEQNALKARFQMLALTSNPDKFSVQLEFKALLLHLFVNHLYKCMSVGLSGIPDWLGELQEMMQLKENFIAGLPKLLELSGKSQEHVNRSVKKHFGITTTEWLNGFKLQHASGLLQYSEDEIMSIALESGFENLSHFYHVFKRNFRISPAKYRNAHKKIIIPQ